jgi:hypothetical protein
MTQHVPPLCVSIDEVGVSSSRGVISDRSDATGRARLVGEALSIARFTEVLRGVYVSQPFDDCLANSPYEQFLRAFFR